MLEFIELTKSNLVIAAALAVIAFSASVFFKRKPAIAHVLWMVVLIKLVTPTVFSTNMQEVTQESMEVAGVTETHSAPIDPDIMLSVSNSELARLKEERRVESNSKMTFRALLGLWLFGSIAWFMISVKRIVTINRLLKLGELASAEIQSRTRQLAQKMGVRKVPEVFLMKTKLPPLVWCLGRTPRIFIPSSLSAVADRQRVDLVLAHELAHISRRDYLVRWFELFVITVHWWNPLAWFGVRQLRVAEEQCCDAMVLELFSEKSCDYVETLIAVSDSLVENGPAPLMVSGLGSGSSLNRRCKMILTKKLTARMGWLPGVMILALAIAVLPTSLQAQKRSGSSDLKKRIERLEQMVEQLHKSMKKSRVKDVRELPIRKDKSVDRWRESTILDRDIKDLEMQRRDLYKEKLKAREDLSRSDRDRRKFWNRKGDSSLEGKKVREKALSNVELRWLYKNTDGTAKLQRERDDLLKKRNVAEKDYRKLLDSRNRKSENSIRDNATETALKYLANVRQKQDDKVDTSLKTKQMMSKIDELAARLAEREQFIKELKKELARLKKDK